MFFVLSICALNTHVAVRFHTCMRARVSSCSNNSCTDRGSRLAFRCCSVGARTATLKQVDGRCVFALESILVLNKVLKFVLLCVHAHVCMQAISFHNQCLFLCVWWVGAFVLVPVYVCGRVRILWNWPSSRACSCAFFFC